MNEMMTFPDTWEEFEKLYGFNDAEEIYTNNSRLIPSFRVKQWLDHLPSMQPKEQCIATITLNGEDIERIVKEQVEEIKDSLTRKGKWLIYSTFDDCYYAKCNQCHETQVFYYNKPLTNFCPNCGCRMEEGDSE